MGRVLLALVILLAGLTALADGIEEMHAYFGPAPDGNAAFAVTGRASGGAHVLFHVVASNDRTLCSGVTAIEESGQFQVAALARGATGLFEYRESICPDVTITAELIGGDGQQLDTEQTTQWERASVPAALFAEPGEANRLLGVERLREALVSSRAIEEASTQCWVEVRNNYPVPQHVWMRRGGEGPLVDAPTTQLLGVVPVHGQQRFQIPPGRCRIVCSDSDDPRDNPVSFSINGVPGRVEELTVFQRVVRH